MACERKCGVCHFCQKEVVATESGDCPIENCELREGERNIENWAVKGTIRTVIIGGDNPPTDGE